MPRKTYSPYKVQSSIINRFRGVVNPENELTMNKMFVGASMNMECFRWGELTSRAGQIKEAI